MEELIVCSQAEVLDVDQRNNDIEKTVLDKVRLIETQQIVQDLRGKDDRNRIEAEHVFRGNEDEDGGEKEELLDSQVCKMLEEINAELEVLAEDGEERFRLNKLYSSMTEIGRTNQVVSLVKSMQRFVNGLLKSEELKEVHDEREISKIINADGLLSINSTIANAFSQINQIKRESDDLYDINDSNVDFQIALETKELNLKFISEFCEIEQNIANLENKIGNLANLKTPSIKQMIFSIMKDISKIKISETEKLRENIQLLQKEIKSLFLTIFKNQEENKDSSNSESSGSLDSSQTNESDSANPKLLCNKLNIVYELAEKSYFEMDTALAIVSRLKGIKKIHEDSPNIQQNINAISKSSSTINELNLKVKQSVESMKIHIDKEFNLIFKELTECEKDIASL